MSVAVMTPRYAARSCTSSGRTRRSPASSPRNCRRGRTSNKSRELVTPEVAAKDIPCGPDVQPILDAVGAYLEAGYTDIYFHQIGPDQDALFTMWEAELGDAVRALAG